MKKTKLILILFLIVTVILPTVAFATEDVPVVTSADTTADGATETQTSGATSTTSTTDDSTSSDKYFAGDNIIIDTVIDGNVFVVGKEVTVTGRIGGDLFVIAEKLTVDGGTDGGLIYGNIFGVVSDMVITTGQLFDIYATCDKLTIDFDVIILRDIKAIAREVEIDGWIGRNVFVETDKLTIKDKCAIDGNLNYTAPEKATFTEATEEIDAAIQTGIKGETNYKERKSKIFNSQDAVKSRVDSILKSNKINNDTSEETVQKLIAKNVMDFVGVDSNADIVKDNNFTILKTVRVPLLVLCILIVLLVVLLVVVVIMVISKNNVTSKEKVNMKKPQKVSEYKKEDKSEDKKE